MVSEERRDTANSMILLLFPVIQHDKPFKIQSADLFIVRIAVNSRALL
jgi:hypothetical protein